MALPTGTVTFLFTDIERSTLTAELLGNELYADVLDEHRGLLRSAFDAHAGHEVATDGDAFFFAFDSAHKAVAAAVDAQRAIETFAWPGGTRVRVRIGVHTGEALVRSEDYVGHDVHKAKRICDAGHGGQILLSQTTADLVAGSSSLIDLGPHRLKDLGEPQRVFQIRADALPHEFPPLRSLESFRHNLPAQRTTFVGRTAELGQLQGMLDRERLVTLTGVGGVGKTRLAVQTGAELLDAFADGVYFIDLAPIAEPDAVAQAIAEALGLGAGVDLGAGGGRGATDDRVIAHLTTRTCLIILDNCEHLLDACAYLADRLLSSCPNVTILATSREALDIEGEQAWRLPSLSLPETAEARDSEAVSLFKARANAVRPGFDVTPSNTYVVAEICRRLDGIPLAIELAASRVSHMTPQEIATRLGDMFGLLTGGRRRRVQRQQTLQAALDWSYDLLTPTEKALLRRLAVFAGSFSLDAAEGICTSDEIDVQHVLDVLGSLVAKSLVGAEEISGSTRYRLMETVRHYAGEKLREAGEADTFRAKHADWFRDWVVSSVTELTNVSTALSVELATEYPNISVALERFDDEGRADQVLRIAARLMAVFAGYGYLEAGHRWLSVARPEDVDISNDERITILTELSYLVNVLQLPGSAELSQRAIDLAEREPSVYAIRAYGQRSYVAAIRSEMTHDAELADEARRGYADVERLVALNPSEWRVFDMHMHRATVELILGDYAAADAALHGLTTKQLVRTGRVGVGAVAAHLAGSHDRAVEIAHLTLDNIRALRGRRAEANLGAAGLEATTLPAVALAGAGRLEEARRIYRDLFDDAISSGQLQGLEISVIAGAAIAFLEGDHARACRLLAWSRARTLDTGQILVSQGAYAIYKHYVRLVRESLPGDEARRYRNEGIALSVPEAIALALRTDQSID